MIFKEIFHLSSSNDSTHLWVFKVFISLLHFVLWVSNRNIIFKMRNCSLNFFRKIYYDNKEKSCFLNNLLRKKKRLKLPWKRLRKMLSIYETQLTSSINISYLSLLECQCYLTSPVTERDENVWMANNYYDIYVPT